MLSQTTFRWSETEHKVFQGMKEVSTPEPVLCHLRDIALWGNDNLPVDTLMFDMKNAFACGCPQGTVMGVLCLIHYIDSMRSILPTHIYFKAFADDVEFYSPVHESEEHRTLQGAADDSLEWTARMGLHVSTQKCRVFHYGPGNSRLAYTLGCDLLTSCTDVRSRTWAST